MGRGHSVVYVTMLADKQSLLMSSPTGFSKGTWEVWGKDEETGRERSSGC